MRAEKWRWRIDFTGVIDFRPLDVAALVDLTDLTLTQLTTLRDAVNTQLSESGGFYRIAGASGDVSFSKGFAGMPLDVLKSSIAGELAQRGQQVRTRITRTRVQFS